MGTLQLGELRRDGLAAGLLAGGVIEAAVAGGGHGCRLERALTAAMTLLCLITACLFVGQGYDLILARAFRMPGTRVRPGTPVPTGPALSRARAKSVPFRCLRTLKDGSELVLLRESGNMLVKRRRDAGDRTLARLPDTVARLVCLTVLTCTRRGRAKTARAGPRADHAAGPRCLPGPGNRGSLFWCKTPFRSFSG